MVNLLKRNYHKQAAAQVVRQAGAALMSAQDQES